MGPVAQGNFGLFYDPELGGSDPEQSILWVCSKHVGDNPSRYCNPTFDRFFYDQQMAASDRQRRADFAAMQKIVFSELPSLPLFFYNQYEAVGDNVVGLQRNMLTYPVSPQTWDVSPTH